MLGSKVLPLLALAVSALAVPLIGVTETGLSEEISRDGSKAIISANRVDDIFTDSGALVLERDSHLIFGVEVLDDDVNGLQLNVNGAKMSLEHESDAVPAGPIEIDTIAIPLTASTALSAEQFKVLAGSLPRGLVSAKLSGTVRIISNQVRRVTLHIQVAEVDGNVVHTVMATVMDLIVYKSRAGGPAHFRKYTPYKCGGNKGKSSNSSNSSQGHAIDGEQAIGCFGAKAKQFFDSFGNFIAEGGIWAAAVLSMIGMSFGLIIHIIRMLIVSAREDREYARLASQDEDMLEVDGKPVIEHEKVPLRA